MVKLILKLGLMKKGKERLKLGLNIMFVLIV